MRVLIAVGGTGGHIFPAVGMAEELRDSGVSDIRFIGGNLLNNAYFTARHFPAHAVESATCSLRRPWGVLPAFVKIGRGVASARRFIADFQPDIVVGFGSYYTLPALLAARLAGVPFVLHEGNAVLGKVNRLLAKQALFVATHFPLPNCRLTKMPLRAGFRKGLVTRAEALAYFGLAEDVPTVLIFGGSQGAAVLNRTVAFSGQVIQFTGNVDDVERLQREWARLGVAACIKVKETRMDFAWTAADVAITRAGAATIAEMIEWEVPALLVPFARAADNHQLINARFVQDEIGSGYLLQENELQLLPHALHSLIEEKATFVKNICDYKAHHSAPSLAELLLEQVAYGLH